MSLLGVKGVTTANLAAVQQAIAATADDGSGVGTVASIQAIVNAVPKSLWTFILDTNEPLDLSLVAESGHLWPGLGEEGAASGLEQGFLAGAMLKPALLGPAPATLPGSGLGWSDLLVTLSPSSPGGGSPQPSWGAVLGTDTLETVAGGSPALTAGSPVTLLHDDVLALGALAPILI